MISRRGRRLQRGTKAGLPTEHTEYSEGEFPVCSVNSVGPMAGIRLRSGFSLIEVVVAIGIFAFGMVAVLGLFSPMARSVSGSSEGEAAARLADALRAKLQSMPMAQVETLLKNSTEKSHELTDADLRSDYDITQDAQLLFANRDGSKIGLYTDSIWYLPAIRANWDGEKFFEIALIRNEVISPKAAPVGGGTGTSATAIAPVLAYTARVRWPAFVADTATTAVQVAANPNSTVRFDHGRKEVLYFAGSVTR